MRVRASVAPSTRLAGAVDAQTRAPDGAGGGADWVWVLDGSALPAPGALAALVAAAERLEDAAPALLASVIVGRDGALHPAHLPLLPQGHPDIALATAARRVAHVRATSAGSLLVRPGALAGPVPTGAAAFAWTARLLRDAPGFVVPDSVAEAVGGAPPARATAALLAYGRLRARERLRLAADALTSASRRARHAR